MIKAISKPFVPVLKWGTVIVTTAIVVISIQVNADDVTEPAIRAVDLKMSTAPDGDNNETKVWAPSSGFADLIEQVSPAVVHVGTSGFVSKRRQRTPQFRVPRGFEDFFPEFRNPQPEQDDLDDGEKEKRPLGIGSGFIISADGYVVTNHHVIDKADEIIIRLTNGDEYEAEVKGSDEKTDVALLKLKNAKDLPYVTWGDDEKSRVGDWVLAIGNPFGLGGSASTGIISARGRDIRSGPYDDFIQVDAAINRGNSGGPLFNTKGQVIGINTAIYSPNGGSVGIGFSIPANLAKNVITQLEESGEVERAWIGVGIQALDDELADGFGRDNDEGALITNVEPDTPADKAGIQAGDIILSFDGKDIKKMRDLPRIVAGSSVGKKYKVVIWRSGAKKTMTIKTERYPDDPTVASSPRRSENAPDPKADDVLGAQMSELSDAQRERYRLGESVNGVLVINVERNGLAAKNGLRQGDVISSLDGVAVKTPAQVSDVVSEAKKKGRSTVPILLSRNNGARFMPFKLN